MNRISYFPPPWGWSDYACLWRLAAPGAFSSPAWFTDEIANIDDGRQTASFNSGKSAIRAVLQAWGIGSGDEVIVPAFLCASAVQPIISLGARPVAVDVDPEDLNISVESIQRHLTERTRAILVAHIYGNAALIQPIERLAAERGVKVLDDAAQSYGASLDGKPLGFWGDAGIIAFGPGKSTVSARGGIVIHRGLPLPEPEPESSGTVFAAYAKFILRRCLRRWTQPIIEGLGRSKGLSTESARAACESSFVFGSMAAVDAAVGKNQTARLRTGLIDRRKMNFDILEETLRTLRSARVIKPQRGQSSWVKFPLVLESPKKDIFLSLRGKGIEVYPSYVPLSFYKPDQAERYFADTLSERVLELPLTLTREQTQWMASIVRTTLEEAA